MRAPGWARALLVRVSPPDRAEEVVGDLEEAHGSRLVRHGRLLANIITTLETLDMALALLRLRRRMDRAGSTGASSRAHRSPEGRVMWGSRNSPASWLDFKLGLRMLFRYPGLTLVGGLAIAFAIWVGAGTAELMTQLLHPSLPLPEGDRVVGVRLYDAEHRGIEPRVLHDFTIWRQESATLNELGAYRSRERNLIRSGGAGEPTLVAEMTASGFAVAGVPPHLGRTLAASDESPGAPEVVVLGFDLWQARFSGDPHIVGKTVRLGHIPAQVVGVMPQGFAFPLAHQLWAPLRVGSSGVEPRQGPALQVFGLLAPGVTLEEARAEFETFQRRAVAAWPETHEHLKVEVLPYASAALNLSPEMWKEILGALALSNLFLFGLLGVIGSNVALLIFARAAARESELVVRSALGASRSRIVGQLFAEALVLGGLGALVGLAATGFGLRWALGTLTAQFGRLPFWFSDALSPSTVLYAVALTVAGAAFAGVLPALKVTRGLGDRIRQLGPGGGGLRFGSVWTVVIVTQVAAAVALPATAFLLHLSKERIRNLEVGFAPETYLAARLEMDRAPPPDATGDTTKTAFLARYGATLQALDRLLRQDPGVADVTFADRLPRMYHPWNQIEVDEGALEPPDPRGHRMGVASVDIRYFDVLGTSILAGRGFGSPDLAPDARVVVVNESFVRSVLGGKNPLGRRIRFVASESARTPDHQGPWHEIVGVVEDMGTTSGYGTSGIYRPVAPGDRYPVHLALRVRGDPLAFGPRLLSAAVRLDPTLRVHALIRMDNTVRQDVMLYDFWYRLTTGVSLLALLLSLAGIYSVMSFTVSRRTREIGIRLALGSDPRRVSLAIFRRPLIQTALGITLGSAYAALLTKVVVVGDEAAVVGGFWPRGAALVAVYALVITCVCFLACVVPLRRALGVEPTEALRADG